MSASIPLNGRLLLDTNAVIALFASDTGLQQILESAEVFLTSIVIGELYYGAQNSRQTEQNVARVRELVAANVVLSCDSETAHHYGQIKMSLKSKGRPIPENDIWIAVIARQHNLGLVTRDAHFGHVEQLQVIQW